MENMNLEDLIADMLQCGVPAKAEKQDILLHFSRLLPMPMPLEDGECEQWCIDDLCADDMVIEGDRYLSAGNVWWLSGGREFNRYSCEFWLEQSKLLYCFVFFKETKNRNRMRLKVGRLNDGPFAEFYDASRPEGAWDFHLPINRLVI